MTVDFSLRLQDSTVPDARDMRITRFAPWFCPFTRESLTIVVNDPTAKTLRPSTTRVG